MFFFKLWKKNKVLNFYDLQFWVHRWTFNWKMGTSESNIFIWEMLNNISITIINNKLAIKNRRCGALLQISYQRKIKIKSLTIATCCSSWIHSQQADNHSSGTEIFQVSRSHCLTLCRTDITFMTTDVSNSCRDTVCLQIVELMKFRDWIYLHSETFFWMFLFDIFYLLANKTKTKNCQYVFIILYIRLSNYFFCIIS